MKLGSTYQLTVTLLVCDRVTLDVKTHQANLDTTYQTQKSLMRSKYSRKKSCHYA